MTFWRRIFGPSCKELGKRVLDLETHFVTKRDPATGAVTETLADVPIEKRKEMKRVSTAGMSWPQRRRLLEETDGGRRH
jgi:hypothetical protein